ncbi:Regulator of nonsense transcripts UPF3 [Apostasia shenzhenica]|uniref:Regulator of nonsense transcripts UPF3 n=1 Tax=Apostasia shenzhenica TaxID=1088818 RepID=A0A2I0BG31_9ASPA|nr:Regulator of nonsense transcripts UPF3 [Apostasia shenzhenica]
MKDPVERTKVVLRHLPPSITEGDLVERIDAKLAGRYKWFCFRPGKSSQKNQKYARAYIDFRSPEDVFEFAEFFDGHVFVNERGTQYKVLVEYAPSQRVPKQWTKKDGREGTVLKDPEYMEFLELLAKPAENLPSAEIQLERREAEKAGAPKDVPIVTPLMDFVRQKRAAKSGSQRTSGNGKPSRRAIVSGSSSTPSKRSLEKRRGSTIIYVSKEIAKNEGGKEKPTHILMSRRDDRLSEKTADHPSASGKDVNLVEKGSVMNGSVSGVPVSVETGKKTLLLLKGKDREGSQLHRLEAPGRIIKTILSSRDGRQMSTSQLDSQLITGAEEKGKPPRRPPVPHPNLKEHLTGSLSTSDADGKTQETRNSLNESLHTFVSITDKQDKRLRNKDRPDRGVWAPLRRSGRDTNMLLASEVPFGHGDPKHEMAIGNRTSDFKSLGGGRGSYSSLDNGAHRQAGRRGTAHNLKDVDASLNATEGKPSKRGGSTGYAPHERQVWVQKSGSGS